MSSSLSTHRPVTVLWTAIALVALLAAACNTGDEPAGQTGAANAEEVATEEEAPEPITVEPLARAGFTDDVRAEFAVTLDGDELSAATDDASDVMMVRLILQPEARIGWHTHPGPVLVAVEQGALAYVEHDCSERLYEAGSAFVDPGGGHVHSAYNASDDVTVLYATFLGVDNGPTQPAEDIAPDHCP